MTLQQWLFSFKGRIGRRDFWIWIALWLVSMLLLFMLTDRGLLKSQNAAFILVCLLWPTAAVVVKRLHDRGQSGLWALLLIFAWMLFSGNWMMFYGILRWAIGTFVPTVIFVMLVLNLGAIIGSPGENKFGKETSKVKFR